MVIYHRIRKASPKKQNQKTKPTKLTKQIIQTNNGRIRKKHHQKGTKKLANFYSRALALWIWKWLRHSKFPWNRPWFTCNLGNLFFFHEACNVACATSPIASNLLQLIIFRDPCHNSQHRRPYLNVSGIFGRFWPRRSYSLPWCSFSPSCLVVGSCWFWKHLARLFRQNFTAKMGKNYPSHTGHTGIWSGWTRTKPKLNWLVVSTHLKNISQNGNLPQIGVKIKNIWNHHPVKKTLRSHPKDGIVDEGTVDDAGSMWLMRGHPSPALKPL